MRQQYKNAFFSLMLLSAAGPAMAQGSPGLFIEMESLGVRSMSTSTMEESRGILSKNKVNVNVQALRNGSAVYQPAKSKKMAADPDGTDGFLMQLPDGTVVTLVTNRLHSYMTGVETYSGRIKDIETGHFTLSIENDRVYGQVNIDYMSYDIKYDKTTRSHVLSEIDQARMPHHAPEPLGSGTAYETTSQSIGIPTPMLSGSAIGTVRVLILHGSDVSNPSTLASNIISKMNDTFFDDKMDPDLHVTLADLRNLNDDLDGVCKEDILYDMYYEDAPFANIATWIDDEDADVVLTIATTDTSLTTCQLTGTLGGIGGIAFMMNPDYPYAVTMDTYAIGDLTAVHEVGHVLGGGHPTTTDSQLQAYSDDIELYSRGYIAGDGDWQTVMGSYDDDDCDLPMTFPITNCVRLPLWSDPTKSYDGETRGATTPSDPEDPLAADMASALEIQMPIVAAWESYPYSAPGTPTGVFVEKCRQSNVITWNSVSNAEHYQVLVSLSSSFTNPEVVYFGTQLGMIVSVVQGSTKYAKIRACNGSGCGSYTSQETLSYSSTCN